MKSGPRHSRLVVFDQIHPDEQDWRHGEAGVLTVGQCLVAGQRQDNQLHIAREECVYPKVKAIASNGANWIRTIKTPNGKYEIIKTSSGIQIVP